MVTKAITATTVGIDAYKIEVEVDVSNSFPGISIVGLPDNAVNEARERVHSAIKNSGFSLFSCSARFTTPLKSPAGKLSLS